MSDPSPRIFESVPNVSTADPRLVRELAATLSRPPQVRLVHVDADEKLGRSCFTVLGERGPLLDALVALARRCNELVDLRTQDGLHPRLGALDVVPLVALQPEGEDAAAAAAELRRRLREEAELWCVAFGTSPSEELGLAELRSGGSARLFRRIEAGEIEAQAPLGDSPERRLARGLTCVGARGPLVSLDVELATGELRVARRIAGQLHEATGGLQAVRAIALKLGAERTRLCLSLVDHRVTDVATAHSWVARLAEESGLSLLGTELVGCAPRAAWPKGLGRRIGEDAMVGEAEERRILETWLPGGRLAEDEGLSKEDLPRPSEAAADETGQGAPAEPKLRLLDLSPAEAEQRLAAILEGLGERSYRAGQVLNALWQRRVRDLGGVTELPKPLRERLDERIELGLLEISERAESSDGTVKYLWRCPDGSEIESVSIPTERRTTFCPSSQVGCSLKCKFCATGYLGFGRNLSAGEIVDQALGMLADLKLSSESLNIVFMGMGEPGHNLKSVMRALHSFNDPAGLGVGARRITVSTSGVVPAIREMAEQTIQFRLALSLHAADQGLRASLMNIAAKHSLEDLKASLEAYQHATKRHVTFEYCLIPGVNDGRDNAEKLAVWAAEIASKVNLIPYNPVEEFRTAPATNETCVRFREQLAAAGYKGDVVIRQTRGRDIEAACGMLHRHRSRSAADASA